jgi:hypothetical protein
MERRNREQWAELIDEQKASGHSFATFCQRRGIRERTLHWWRWKLGSERRSKKPSAVRMLPVEMIESSDTDFDGEFVLQWDDVTLKFRAGTPPKYVATLLATIRSR